jgi:type I restriction enzyme S subunit
MTAWREVELGDGLDVLHGYAFQGEHFHDEGDLVVLTPGNFFDAGGFKRKNGKEKYYDGTFPERFLLDAGDVVVAMTEQAHGLLGSSATIPVGGVYLHNQRIGLIRITDPELLDERFVYHLMNTPPVRTQIQATATGSKVRHTAPERIKSIRVSVPSVMEQRRLASILDAIDDLIQNNGRRAAVLEEMARTIYREWFVHFRYPGHEEVPLVDSRLGPIPDGWVVAPLESIAGVNRRSRKPTQNEVVHYLDISALGERSIGHISELIGGDAPGRARRVVEAGDVVWSMVRPNRRAHALLVAPDDTWIASTGLAVLSATEVSSTWLFEMVSAKEFSDYLVSQEGGAAYPAVKPKDFEGAPVLVPIREVDEAFAGRVAPLHRIRWSLDQQSAALASLRDLLLTRLVTGQIDVSRLHLDALTEAVTA